MLNSMFHSRREMSWQKIGIVQIITEQKCYEPQGQGTGYGPILNVIFLETENNQFLWIQAILTKNP